MSKSFHPPVTLSDRQCILLTEGLLAGAYLVHTSATIPSEGWFRIYTLRAQLVGVRLGRGSSAYIRQIESMGQEREVSVNVEDYFQVEPFADQVLSSSRPSFISGAAEY